MSEQGRPLSFVAELQRRNVHRAAIFYAGAAWLLVQIATQVFPFFHIAEWVVRWIVIAVVIGFPFAMLFSWFYEWTPQGIKRESEIVHTESITRETGKKLDRAIIAVLSLAVVLLLANTFVLHEDKGAVASPPAASSAPAKSIAVLPFTDLSPTHDQEYFSDGMAEELLNALAKVKDLKVAGRTSSFSFKGRNEDLREIGKALGVGTILEGSVRKQGDKVRIAAQLIRSDNGFDLWSETYDGDLKDVFALQEQIARAITDALKVVLIGKQQQQLVPVATDSPEAYALFLKATTIFNQRDGAHFSDAISMLQQAIRLDPRFARAHARLAALYAVATSYTAIGPDEANAAVEREAQIAIRLDPTLAEPLAAQGLVDTYQRRWLDSHAKLEQAVALDPSDLTANFWLASDLIVTGYSTKGTAQLDHALTIDPLLPNGLYWRGLLYLWSGDRTQARRLFERARDAGLKAGEQGLGFIDHDEGRNAEAIDEMTRGTPQAFLYDFPNDAGRLIAEGMFDGAAARARALAIIDAYVATRPKTLSGGVPWALLLLGEPARTLAVAHDAPTRNDPLFMTQLWSPNGAAARRLPQFAEFARKVGWTDLWDQYGPPDKCQRRAARDYVCE